jgi:DNA-binding NtrC family response regulator
MTKVASAAGLERTHLYRKLKQLGLEVGKAGRASDKLDNLHTDF